MRIGLRRLLSKKSGSREVGKSESPEVGRWEDGMTDEQIIRLYFSLGLLIFGHSSIELLAYKGVTQLALSIDKKPAKILRN